MAEEACIVPPKPTSHPTVSQVICNLVIATASDTCTATVGDAATAGSTNPTGTVSFASSSGGVFSTGNVQPHADAVVEQRLELLRAVPAADTEHAAGDPATYSGDATHNSSTAQTHYGPASCWPA